jgi:hypothetical protein
MKIELDFTELEMELFLSMKGYLIKPESRLFDCSDIFTPETPEEARNVLVVYNREYNEIMVADEKNYQSKSSVLKETFIKEFKKSLLLN